jgi:hypothetical protein
MPANPNFDDLATTTIQHYSKELADNATVSNAGLDRARRKGKVQTYDGGRTILQELEVSLNPYGGWFADLDFLDTRRHQPFSAAEYQRKQAFVPCVWSGSEKRANRGRTQMIDLVAKRVENSRKTLFDLVATAYYSDGLSFGGKQMHGLDHLVVASPSTGTVGGIDRATNTFWRNKTGTVDFDAAINIITANPPTFLTAMTTLGIAVSRGKDHADMWLFDAIGFQRYMECLQPIQRVTDPKMAGYGFQSMKFWAGGADSDVVLDNGHCPTKTGFALNTDYIYLRPHEDLNFVALGGERQPVNQDATVRFFGFEGNLCASVLFTQGRLSDV